MWQPFRPPLDPLSLGGGGTKHWLYFVLWWVIWLSHVSSKRDSLFCRSEYVWKSTVSVSDMLPVNKSSICDVFVHRVNLSSHLATKNSTWPMSSTLWCGTTTMDRKSRSYSIWMIRTWLGGGDQVDLATEFSRRHQRDSFSTWPGNVFQSAFSDWTTEFTINYSRYFFLATSVLLLVLVDKLSRLLVYWKTWYVVVRYREYQTAPLCCNDLYFILVGTCSSTILTIGTWRILRNCWKRSNKSNKVRCSFLCQIIFLYR